MMRIIVNCALCLRWWTITSCSTDQFAKRDPEMIEHWCVVGQGPSDDKVGNSR